MDCGSIALWKLCLLAKLQLVTTLILNIVPLRFERNDDEYYFDLFMFPVDAGERSCSAALMYAVASMA